LSLGKKRKERGKKEKRGGGGWGKRRGKVAPYEGKQSKRKERERKEGLHLGLRE